MNTAPYHDSEHCSYSMAASGGVCHAAPGLAEPRDSRSVLARSFLLKQCTLCDSLEHN